MQAIATWMCIQFSFLDLQIHSHFLEASRNMATISSSYKPVTFKAGDLLISFTVEQMWSEYTDSK